jgi:hypothetical protein
MGSSSSSLSSATELAGWRKNHPLTTSFSWLIADRLCTRVPAFAYFPKDCLMLIAGYARDCTLLMMLTSGGHGGQERPLKCQLWAVHLDAYSIDARRPQPLRTAHPADVLPSSSILFTTKFSASAGYRRNIEICCSTPGNDIDRAIVYGGPKHSSDPRRQTTRWSLATRKPLQPLSLSIEPVWSVSEGHISSEVSCSFIWPSNIPSSSSRSSSAECKEDISPSPHRSVNGEWQWHVIQYWYQKKEHGSYSTHHFMYTHRSGKWNRLENSPPISGDPSLGPLVAIEDGSLVLGTSGRDGFYRLLYRDAITGVWTVLPFLNEAKKSGNVSIVGWRKGILVMKSSKQTEWYSFGDKRWYSLEWLRKPGDSFWPRLLVVDGSILVSCPHSLRNQVAAAGPGNRHYWWCHLDPEMEIKDGMDPPVIQWHQGPLFPEGMEEIVQVIAVQDFGNAMRSY